VIYIKERSPPLDVCRDTVHFCVRPWYNTMYSNLDFLPSPPVPTSQGQPYNFGSIFPQYYNQVKIAHAVLGSLAWVIFFPLGAILVRLLKPPYAVRVHGTIQIFAYSLLIAGAGMGIWMARWTLRVSDSGETICIMADDSMASSMSTTQSLALLF